MIRTVFRIVSVTIAIIAVAILIFKVQNLFM
jgi:CubicO group peptidase (beta-lactamase class C family)